MKKNKLYLSAAKYLTFALILFLLPLTAFSSRLFHSIQTGSFRSVAVAEKQFNSIVHKLDEKELGNLRIEKIGKFYSVRLGKFENFSAAEKFLQAIKNRLPHASVMEVYIKDERIKKIYKDRSSAPRFQPLRSFHGP